MSKKFVSVLSIILAVLLVLSLVLMVLPAGAHAATQSQLDSLKTQQAALTQKKKAAATQISTLKSKQASYVEQKAAMDQQCELTRQDIALLEKQITLYDNMIEKKGEELKTAEINRDEQLEKYRTRVRAMEENGKYNYFAVLFSANSLSDLLAKMDDIGEIMQSDKELEDSYKASVVECTTLKKEYEDTQADMKVKQSDLVTEKKNLETQISQATAMIASLQSNINEYTATYNEYAAADSALISEMNKLSAQLAKEAEEAKKNQNSNNNSNSGSSSVVGTGSFSFPVPGYSMITSKYGNRYHPIFHTTKFHSGIDIAAGYDTPIYAADAGTVVVATKSSSYGNYVMINHANGYTTLYAHMNSMAVSVGQTVKKGATIGYVGSTGNSTGPHCHFEVRYNGSTTNPAAFFSGLRYSSDA